MQENLFITPIKRRVLDSKITIQYTCSTSQYCIKGHSCSPWLQQNVHICSLELPKIFLPALFPSHSFYVCQISIHCFIFELQCNHVCH